MNRERRLEEALRSVHDAPCAQRRGFIAMTHAQDCQACEVLADSPDSATTAVEELEGQASALVAALREAKTMLLNTVDPAIAGPGFKEVFEMTAKINELVNVEPEVPSQEKRVVNCGHDERCYECGICSRCYEKLKAAILETGL